MSVKKNVILTFMLCSLAFFAQAQLNIDSLWTVFQDKSQSDTSRLKAIDKIVHAYRNQPDNALFYVQYEYDLAESTGNKKWAAKALMKKGISFHHKNKFVKAREYLTQSSKTWEEVGDKKGIANCLFYIGRTYRFQVDNAQALNYYTQSLKIREEIGDKKDIANSLLYIGDIYSLQGEYAQAKSYYTQSLKNAEEVRDVKGMALSFKRMGQHFATQGDYFQALYWHNRMLTFAEEVRDKYNIASAKQLIGELYKQQNDYSRALEYGLAALTLFEDLGVRSDRLWQYLIVGEYYKLSGDTIQAMKYFIQAQDFNKIVGSKRVSSLLLSGMGDLFLSRGDYAQAQGYLMKALVAADESGFKPDLALILNQTGNLFLGLGDYSQAIHWCKKGLVLSEERNFIDQQQGACKCLYQAHKSLKQGMRALAYHEQMLILKDSLKNDKTRKQLDRMEFDKKILADSLDYAKKEFDIQLTHQTELQNQSRTRNILLVAGLIALLGAIAFWFRVRYIQKTNIQLEEAKNRAERSEKYKEQFLANMSHEIRTPMHAISGMVKILERKKHLTEQEVFLDAMHKSSDNLIVLLNDILDLSKIEAGKLDVENMPMQPAPVIHNVHQILQFKAEEKGLELKINMAEDLPEFVMGDPTRLGQILTNLAGNAIKFTEKGSVGISVSKKNDFIIYEVRDTGIGIPDDKLQSIFDAFEQAEGSTARRFGGTGLGLNISRQLVELMGGNIWAESDVGKGSAFFVSLPLVAVEGDITDKQSLSVEQIMEMGAALSGKRILLAEDNAFNQMIAADDLEYYAKGIQVDIVENGRLAFEKAQTGLYDLILMDVQMPEMDGIEASLKIREWEQANDKSPIPIIAMTASLLKSEVNLCLEAGMDNYVPKPYEAEELVGRMYEEVKAV